jgi:AraC family transcriptional regulator
LRNPDDNDADAPPVDYVKRVNLVLDHVMRHLDGPLRLEELARVAGFSPFHFHRVFGALMGEPLGQFVKRLRLDRALQLMAHAGTRSQRPRLTEIALACGFASSSDFTRAFKQRHGVPPSAFDLASWRREHRDELESVADGHRHLLERLPPRDNPDGFVAELRDLPARTVAYIRVLDPYRGDGVLGAARRLLAWAEERGLADGQWLGYQWENPEIVALEHCRYDMAVEVPRDHRFEPDGEVGRFELPPMRVAQVAVRGGVDLELRALDWLFTTWLPASGYVPDDLPAFEAFLGRPFAHGTEYFELDAQLPVRRA